MSENSVVKDKECDAKRKDLYDKIEKSNDKMRTLKEVQDQMKGGIKVICYGVPIVLACFGFFCKIELNRIHEAVNKRPMTVSAGSASVSSSIESEMETEAAISEHNLEFEEAE